MGVAVVRLILMYRYSRNEEYRKAVEISNKDERNKFLATQARNWTMYFTVLILSALCFAFQVAGQTLLSECCGFIVCGMMVIYWIAYLILRRKY